MPAERLADEFTNIFREEHRVVRDALFELLRALRARDRVGITTLLDQIKRYTGPHFRYEEESLYPMLVPIFGEEYIEKLYEDHDRAIGSARKLLEIAQKGFLTDDDITQVIRMRLFNRAGGVNSRACRECFGRSILTGSEPPRRTGIPNSKMPCSSPWEFQEEGLGGVKTQENRTSIPKDSWCARLPPVIGTQAGAQRSSIPTSSVCFAYFAVDSDYALRGRLSQHRNFHRRRSELRRRRSPLRDAP
jgi:hypothetical protein